MPARVLIIDDDRDACDLLCAYLAGAGYAADVRFDGQSAIEAFRESPYDVVISDIRMPTMDGLEVLRALKTIDPEVGVIIVSAVQEDLARNTIEALRGGAADYFGKAGLDLAELERSVARAAGRRAERRAEAQQLLDLEHLARTDPLTGLANRLELEQRLREEFSRLERGEEEFAIALLDVDSFKLLNDTEGHIAGDKALVAVASAVRASCRAYDIKARYGGDEFMIVMPDTDIDQAVAVTEKVRRTVAASSAARGGGARALTLSAGVTSARPREAITPEGLIRRADLALYEAKKAGKNQTITIGPGGPTADVLLIEADAAEAEAIVRMCEILGCRADWARTGSAGIERAKLSRYALALVGLTLPDLEGTEAISRIKEISPATATALVADADPSSAKALDALTRFPVTFARKPLSIDHLKVLLSEARRRS